MAADRMPLLDRLRPHPDPTESTDPDVRDLLAALRQLEIAPAPSAHFRDELRTQLVAVAPRLIEQGAAEAAESGARARGAGKVATHAGAKVAAPEPRRRSFARPLLITASVVMLLAMVLGGVTWLSQKSLPGDSLYGVKRASEDLRLKLASSPTARSDDQLEFATRRVDEARDLLRQDPRDARTAELVAQALRSSNDDVTTASRQLNSSALKSHSGDALATMIAWAPGQLQRLQSLVGASFDPATRADATASWGVVHSALGRATAVRTIAALSCAASARSDRFGPVPAACPAAAPSTAPSTHKSAPASAPASAQHRSHSAGTHGSATTGNSVPGTGGKAATSHAPAQPKSSTGLKLPVIHLPTPKASAPITVNSCGVKVSLGPIGANIGSCPTKHA